MEVSKDEQRILKEAGVKIDPPWKRVLYFVLAIVAVPLSVYVLGWLGGIIWRLFKLGLAHGAN